MKNKRQIAGPAGSLVAGPAFSIRCFSPALNYDNRAKPGADCRLLSQAQSTDTKDYTTESKANALKTEKIRSREINHRPISSPIETGSLFV